METFIIYSILTVVLIFIVIFTTFRATRPSSGVFFCRSRVPTRNFEVKPLPNSRGLIVLILLTIIGFERQTYVSILWYFYLLIGLNLQSLVDFTFINQTRYATCPAGQYWVNFCDL